MTYLVEAKKKSLQTNFLIKTGAEMLTKSKNNLGSTQKDGVKTNGDNSNVNTPDAKPELNDSKVKPLTIDVIQKDYSIDDIFLSMNAKSARIKQLHTLITDLEINISTLKEQKVSLSLRVKPVGRLIKKFNPEGLVFDNISFQDRKAIKLEIKIIKNQLILLNNQLSELKKELSSQASTINNELKKDELINKAQSNDWTKRNRWSIEARIIKTLNNSLKKDQSNLVSLQSLASSEAINAKEEFAKALQNFLDNEDAETSILCSYKLRSSLYEAIRLTLTDWDNSLTPEFTKLIIPNKQ